LQRQTVLRAYLNKSPAWGWLHRSVSGKQVAISIGSKYYLTAICR
jgi:hypothetical protein